MFFEATEATCEQQFKKFFLFFIKEIQKLQYK